MLSKSSWSRVTLVVVLAILVSAIGMVSPALAASYVLPTYGGIPQMWMAHYNRMACGFPLLMIPASPPRW